MKRTAHTLAIVSVGLSIAVSCALVVLPVYASGDQGRTLLQVNGLQAAFVLLLPVIMSLVGLEESWALRLLGASALLVFALLTGIGRYYIPSAVCLLVAADRTTRAAPTTGVAP